MAAQPATDPQMQAFADNRIRPDAEKFRSLIESCNDAKNSNGDEYARAISNVPWADKRIDPAHLLQAGNNASPDDFLNHNACITTLLALVAGTATPQQVADFPGQYAVWMRACVQPDT